mgnify:CR=1 FL=1
MKYMRYGILFVLFLGGCASGKLSVSEGNVRFAIPFDFPGPAQQGQDLRVPLQLIEVKQKVVATVREGKIAEQMQHLEKQKAQEKGGTQK